MLHISNNIKLIRELYEQTQEEFVQHFSGVTVSMQKSYETGRAKPGVLYLNQLSKMTGVPIDKLKDSPVEIEKVQKGEKVEKVDGVPIETALGGAHSNTTEMSREQRDWKQAHDDLMKAHTRYSKSHLILSQALYEMTNLLKEIREVKTNLDRATKVQAGNQAVIVANQDVMLEAFEEISKKPAGEYAKRADNLRHERLQDIVETGTVDI